MTAQRAQVRLYSDGGAEPNPGKGGFGVILKYGRVVKEWSGSYVLTTNNRMELMAIIFGLAQLTRPVEVHVYSDSKYVVDAMNKGWAAKWKRNGWMRNKKDRAENSDLWNQLLKFCDVHTVHFNWVKGHAGHPENERCDALATHAIKNQQAIDDTGYVPKGEEGSVGGLF